MMKSFVVGLIGGAAMAWWLKDRFNDRIRALREAAANRLHAAADAVEGSRVPQPEESKPTRIPRVS